MISLNSQPAEKRVERENGALDVVDVWSTIQGEGPFAGVPAVFIRLAGCNLRCPACDTNYTDNRLVTPIKDLVEKVRELGPHSKPKYRSLGLVVITGGEPFRQNCGPLVRALIMEGYRVQFETNGTLYDKTMEKYWSAVTVICSPKTASINTELAPHVTSFKYVLREGEVDPVDGLPTSSLLAGVRPYRHLAELDHPIRAHRRAIYVQPLDECDGHRNKLNTEAAVQSCLEYGYTLQLQIHKIVGLL